MASSTDSGLTLTTIGCGNMGIAILNGILTSLAQLKETDNSSTEELPPRLPKRFIATVRRQETVTKVEKALAEHASSLKVQRGDNVAAVREADIILLGCKPYMIKDILGEKGMVEALDGKLLISICAGVTAEHLTEAVYAGSDAPRTCTMVRAMCNTAALIRESMTVIGVPNPPLQADTSLLVTWIFKQVGDVVHLPSGNMDASTALCGSGPAFFALMMEAAIDGAVAMGLPRVEAQRMAVQTMRGTTGLVQSGEHPAILREKVCTPGGCTIGGLMVLEENRVRGSISRTIREATVIASQLGQGAQMVNGTRHGSSNMPN